MQGQDDPRRRTPQGEQSASQSDSQQNRAPQRRTPPPTRAQQQPGQARAQRPQQTPQPPRAGAARSSAPPPRPAAGRNAAQPPRGPQQPGQPGGPRRPPEEKPRRRRSENRWFRAIVMVLISIGVSIFLALFTLQSVNDLLGFSQPDQQIEITIPEGATIPMVSSLLKEAGIIDQQLTFRLYTSFKTSDEELKPGDYVLNSNMGYNEIILKLSTGDTTKAITTITFIEGWTLREVADLLEEEGVCDAQEFIDYLDSAEYTYEFFNALEMQDNTLRYHLLEGYIFPDTYEFYMPENVESVARKFTRRFDEMMTTDLLNRMQEMNMTIDETITLASIIQREAGDSDDMRLVSSVFHNRLNAAATYPSLQSDVTILYVENNIKPYIRQTNQDLYDAYNTYVCVGLPVGPICNPGIDAIEAALYPENTGFYFFVTDENGDFYYATNPSDHYNNVAIAMQEGEVHGIDTQ